VTWCVAVCCLLPAGAHARLDLATHAERRNVHDGGGVGGGGSEGDCQAIVLGCPKWWVGREAEGLVAKCNQHEGVPCFCNTCWMT
jgi:hypothetical protein